MSDDKLLKRLRSSLWNHQDPELRNDARFMIRKLEKVTEQQAEVSEEVRLLQKRNAGYAAELLEKEARLNELFAVREENDRLRVKVDNLTREMHGLLLRENHRLMNYLSDMADRERDLKRPTFFRWLRVMLGTG